MSLLKISSHSTLAITRDFYASNLAESTDYFSKIIEKIIGPNLAYYVLMRTLLINIFLILSTIQIKQI